MVLGQDSQLSQGPFLSIAALCEAVVREENGTLTLVRVIDQVTITVPQALLERQQPVPFTAFLVVSFRAGFFEGPATLAIGSVGPPGAALLSPSGANPERRPHPVLFEGQ